jgi:hypothetical protein
MTSLSAPPPPLWQSPATLIQGVEAAVDGEKSLVCLCGCDGTHNWMMRWRLPTAVMGDEIDRRLGSSSGPKTTTEKDEDGGE